MAQTEQQSWVEEPMTDGALKRRRQCRTRPHSQAHATTTTHHETAPYARPKTRQRIHKSPEPLAVPDIEDDAAERKRVLNVLAQRRYRERRRQARTKASTAQGGDALPVEPNTSLEGFGNANARAGMAEQDSYANLSTSPEGMAPMTLADLAISPSLSLVSFDFGLGQGSCLAGMASTPSWDPSTSSPSDSAGNSASSSSNSLHSTPSSGDGVALAVVPSAAIDPLLVFGNEGGTENSNNVPSSPSAADHLSPDSYFLPVTELTLLRAVLRIATRLGCGSSVWQLDGQSPFHIGSSCGSSSGSGLGSAASCAVSTAPNTVGTEDSIALLPGNWKPTPAQRSIAHHPVLDVLPWPTVREKLIGIFSLPTEARPPAAADPLALVHFIYDLEDSAEGLRIWGSDPFDSSCWEVGQLVFERWWFVFDRDVLEQSNRWREMRGAAQLRQAPTDTSNRVGLDLLWG